MKLTIFFMDRAPITVEGSDRFTIEHAGALYRITPQHDALGVRLDQPLADTLVAIPFASNGVDLVAQPHDDARRRKHRDLPTGKHCGGCGRPARERSLCTAGDLCALKGK